MKIERFCYANLQNGEGLSALIFTRGIFVQYKAKWDEIDVKRLCCVHFAIG